jgi:hypothetical protein
MRIPEVRARLVELADETGNDELRDLAAHLYRRPAVRRAMPRSRPMTPELEAEIRSYADRHPRATLAQIASAWDVNPGRVSEALGGKRA